MLANSLPPKPSIATRTSSDNTSPFLQATPFLHRLFYCEYIVLPRRSATHRRPLRTRKCAWTAVTFYTLVRARDDSDC
ncbi:hypothetical protein EVAR_39243_1 [Eumeta japonica]|uniref:Uncharacterized protein n=1 Tax=Eumeta variegata TaxID=151549 RepID=A0A4C1Y2L4_EUMVA|nr:hypothetical protein EVAR_39243_1 [Eumeta japonica]